MSVLKVLVQVFIFHHRGTYIDPFQYALWLKEENPESCLAKAFRVWLLQHHRHAAFPTLLHTPSHSKPSFFPWTCPLLPTHTLCTFLLLQLSPDWFILIIYGSPLRSYHLVDICVSINLFNIPIMLSCCLLQSPLQSLLAFPVVFCYHSSYVVYLFISLVILPRPLENRLPET